MARRAALSDISMTPYIMRVGDTDTNLVLLQQDAQLSASPEEQIIRQRSRRSLFFETAMEVHSGQKVDATLIRCTPTKDDALAQLSRKRLLMSPQKKDESKLPLAKKPRLLKRLSTPINLKEDLKPYSTEELVDIIDKLVFTNPELETEVRDTLPNPDIKQMIEKLHSLRKGIFRAIPSTRWGSSRDAHCYKRVKSNLESFKQTCLEQGRVLIIGHHWECVMKYILASWKVVHQLPTWDDPSHNNSKHNCFRVLAAQCMVAVKHSSLSPSQYYCDLRDRMQKAVLLNKELKPCLSYICKMLENNNYIQTNKNRS